MNFLPKFRYIPDPEERVDGIPYYTLRAFDVAGETFCFRSFEKLPPADAVALLTGDDQTGLILWEGSFKFVEWMLTRTLSSTLRNSLWTEEKEQPDLESAVVVVVELGSGCGLGSMGCLRALSKWDETSTDDAATTATKKRNRLLKIFTTDGNEECVSLSQRNLQSTQQNNDNDNNNTVNVTTQAQVLDWASTKQRERLVEDIRAAVGPMSSSSLLFVSADVLYSPEAVPVLFDCTEALASKMSDVTVCRWVLTFFPRSLTQQSNRRTFELICDRIDAEWRLVCLFQLSPEGEWVQLLGKLNDDNDEIGRAHV